MMALSSLPAAEVRPFLGKPTPVILGSVLVFSRVLDDAEIRTVERYVRKRWLEGLTKRERRQALVTAALERRRARMLRTLRVPGRVEADKFTSALVHECADE